MKAFAVTEYKPAGDLSALKEVSLPKPTATSHDLLVKVKAVATNPIDYKVLANLGNPDAPFDKDGPLVVGWDASGVVEAVGEDTSLFKVGDEVFFAGDVHRPGCFAEYVLVDERIVGTKPKNVSWSQAAGEPLTVLTAWEGIADKLGITPDTTVAKKKVILITGGAGGVATAAIQIAKKVMGLTVIASSSRAETSAYVKEMGADYVVNHREKYAPQLASIGFEEGVDYVYHTSDLSEELFTEFTDILKPLGGLVSIWPAAKVDLFQMFWKSLSFHVVLMFTRPKLKNEESKRQHEIMTSLSKYMEAGTITPRENTTMALTVDNLRKALEMQSTGKAIGKITLAFDE